jgi:hypothetical protein
MPNLVDPAAMAQSPIELGPIEPGPIELCLIEPGGTRPADLVFDPTFAC